MKHFLVTNFNFRNLINNLNFLNLRKKVKWKYLQISPMLQYGPMFACAQAELNPFFYINRMPIYINFTILPFLNNFTAISLSILSINHINSARMEWFNNNQQQMDKFIASNNWYLPASPQQVVPSPATGFATLLIDLSSPASTDGYDIIEMKPVTNVWGRTDSGPKKYNLEEISGSQELHRLLRGSYHRQLASQ